MARTFPGASWSRSWLGRISARVTGANKLTLRARILTVLTFAAIPGFLVAIFFAGSMLQGQADQIRGMVDRLAKLSAAQHEIVLENARTLLEAVVRTDNTNGAERARCEAFMSGWVDRKPGFSSLTLFGPGGAALCSDANGNLPADVGSEPWFRRAVSERSFTVSDYALLGRSDAVLVAAYPALDPQGDVVGVAAVAVSIRWLRFIGMNVDLPPQATITAFNRAGNLLTHHTAPSAENVEPRQDEGAPPSVATRERMVAAQAGTMRGEDTREEPRMYGFQTMEAGSLVVAIGLPRYVEYARYGNALLHTLFVPVLVLVFALAAAALAAELFVTRHVRELISTAEAIADGDLSARSDVPYEEAELGALSEAFNEMATEIEAHQDTLTEKADMQGFLYDELNHRLSNVMTLVQAVAHQTARRATSVSDFNDTFQSRLLALATAHRLLSARRWSSAELGEIVRNILAPYDSNGHERISCDGEEIALESRQAVALGLCLNELATNATKYGALSSSEGAVRVSWRKRIEDGRAEVRLSWRETGGPRVSAPQSAGFGTSTLSRLLMNYLRGQLEVHYPASGFQCEIGFPLQAEEAVAPPA